MLFMTLGPMLCSPLVCTHQVGVLRVLGAHVPLQLGQRGEGLAAVAGDEGGPRHLARTWTQVRPRSCQALGARRREARAGTHAELVEGTEDVTHTCTGE